MFHYKTRVCLLQFLVDGEVFLVDVLAGLPLDGLWSRLAQKHLIMHGSDFDIRLLHDFCRFRPKSIFDTMLAAQLLNRPRVGLASLLEDHFGVKLSKESAEGQLVQAAAHPEDARLRRARRLAPARPPRPAHPRARAPRRMDWLEAAMPRPDRVRPPPVSPRRRERLAHRPQRTPPRPRPRRAPRCLALARDQARASTPRPSKSAATSCSSKSPKPPSRAIPRPPSSPRSTSANATPPHSARSPPPLKRRPRPRSADAAPPPRPRSQQRPAHHGRGRPAGSHQGRPRQGRRQALGIEPTLIANRSQLAQIARRPRQIEEILLPWQAALLRDVPALKQA
jgi:ribonuclease D